MSCRHAARVLVALLALLPAAFGVVSSTTDQVQYTGTGSTATYVVPFVFKQPGDLVVTENTSGTITTLALTSGYTVSGAGLPAGGSITLTAGNLASGVLLTIARVPALTQPVSLPNGSPYFGSTIEGALDLLTMQGQATQSQAARALQFPLGDTAATSVLPSATVRASQFLAFDASGNVITSGGTGSATPISTFWTPIVSYTSAGPSLTALGVSSFQQGVLGQSSAGASRTALGGIPTQQATISALKALATTDLVGATVVQGYHAAGDGGGGIYVWNGSDSTADNGGTIIAPNAGGTGRWHLVQVGPVLDVRQFGAYGDGSHDDTAAITACLTWAAAQTGHGCMVTMGPGTYVISSMLTLPNGVLLRGAGKRATIIQAAAGFSGSYMLQLGATATQVFDTFVERLALACNSVASISGINVNYAQEGCGARSVLIDGFMSKGIDASANTNADTFWQELEIYASATASGTVVGFDIDCPQIVVVRCTVNTDGGGGVANLTHGIRITNSAAALMDIHVEGCTNGIYVAGYSTVHGAEISCGTTVGYHVTTNLINDQSSGYNVFTNVAKANSTTTWQLGAIGASSTAGTIACTTPAVAYLKAMTTPTLSGSPYQYHNNSETLQLVTVNGGTISALGVQRQSSTASVPVGTGTFILAPGDILNITYSVAPTLNVFPMG